jgi:hypothetical protein
MKMEVHEYISKQEVQRVCAELGIRDWTQLSEPIVAIEEAEIIQKIVGGEALMISAEAFQDGLEVELEHGYQFSDANVTNNHPILTGMIVLAHLKEMLDYYARLEVAELEGDLLKAMKAGNSEKALLKYKQLVKAQADLSNMIKEDLQQT